MVFAYQNDAYNQGLHKALGANLDNGRPKRQTPHTQMMVMAILPVRLGAFYRSYFLLQPGNGRDTAKETDRDWASGCASS